MSDQTDIVTEARELLAKATPGPFEVYPIKTMKGDIAGFVWGKYLSDQRDADHFWSSELVPFDDAQMYARTTEILRQLCDEVERLRKQVKQMAQDARDEAEAAANSARTDEPNET